MWQVIVRQLWPLTPNVERAAIGWRRAAFGFSPWRILCKRGQAVPIEIRFRIHEDCIPRVRQFEFIGKSIPVGVETRAGGELAGPLVDVATRKTLVCNEIKGKGVQENPHPGRDRTRRSGEGRGRASTWRHST